MNRTIARLLLLLGFLLPVLPLFANHGHEEGNSLVRFVENKGQWENKILFAADLPLGRVFLEQDRLTYVFCDVADLHDRYFHRTENDPFPFPLDCHSFTVKFANANPAAFVQGDAAESWYHNYFIGNDPSKWASEVPVFEQVAYRDIYPGIHLIIYGKEKGLKYDFVVEPGADPSQIALVYDGLDQLSLKNEQLKIETSILTIIEEAPYAYQNATGVPCEFRVEGNTVRFDMPGGWDHNQQLTIDPNLIFSTFTGSGANNFGFTATYDEDGALFAGGIAYGQGYPITIGAYQTVFGGGAFDMSISKFNTTGGHLWSTYIGGNNVDQPHSLVTNPAGELYIMGRSNSLDYPVGANAYDNLHNGGADIVVSRLNPAGTALLASTFIGGSGDDALNMTTAYVQNSVKFNYGDDARGEIVLDDNGDVYVAGCTQSNNFPFSPGALQTAPGSQQDGCAFKLNADLSNLIWSTYLGGNSNDAAYSIKVDGAGNSYVTGGTASTDFPTTANTVQPLKPGGIDGFITKINPDGTVILASTYIGTPDYNQCYFVELDRDEDVYVVGQKHGAWTVTPGVWSTPSGGQFVSKLSNDLSAVLYSTQFGTSNSAVNISPTAFLVDVCEFVYVSGWGGSVNFEGGTANLPLNNELQTNTDGSDLYIIVLEPDAAGVDFATYMGGTQSAEHVDGGTSRFNKFAEVYQAVCAGCQGNSDFPTTTGAFSPINGSTGCNLACFKLELDLPGMVADFKPDPDSGGCAPHTVFFDNLTNGGNTFLWNFGDPTSGTANTSTLMNPTHTFNNPGVYTVQLIAIDSNTCNVVDTVYKNIQVFAVPVATISPDTSVCEGESVQLNAGGGQNYAWTGGVSNPASASTSASPTVTTTYTVVVTNPGGCADTASVTVEVRPNPTADAGPGDFICPGDSTSLSGTGGVTYAWNPPISLTNPNSANTVAFPSQSTVYTLTVTAANGCTDQDTVSVQVSTVNAEPGNNVDLCIGDQVQLNASGGGTYLWTPGNTLSSTSSPTPVASPTSTTTYYLTVTDAAGCQDTDSLTVVVHELPIVEVGPDLVMCELDSVLLNATGAQSYIWSPSTSLSNPVGATTFAYPTTSTTYILLGTDQWGCENTDTLFIEVLPAPNAVAFDDGVICADSSIQVFANGGNSYTWAPAAVFDDPNLQNPTATLASTTDLVVTVIAANGCDNRDTVTITVTPTPEVKIFGNNLVCLGHQINLVGQGGGPLTWSTGETGPRIQIRPQTDTWYSVSSFENGCPSKPDSLLVMVDDQLPLAEFFISPDSGMLPLTAGFFNQSTGAVSYNWDFGDGYLSNEVNPTHAYQDTGRFNVELIAFNANGCPDTAYHKVIVGSDFTIWVPNAFSPNGDGLNDYFETPWIGVKEFHVQIYDRWGMLIYESFDPSFRWWGIFQGKDCQEGAYVYVIEARGYLSEKVRKAGTVTLSR